MSKPKTMIVRAGDGLVMPLPRHLIIDSPVKFVTDSTEIEVHCSSFVRKRLRCGDLVEVKPKQKDSPRSARKSSSQQKPVETEE